MPYKFGRFGHINKRCSRGERRNDNYYKSTGSFTLLVFCISSIFVKNMYGFFTENILSCFEAEDFYKPMVNLRNQRTQTNNFVLFCCVSYCLVMFWNIVNFRKPYIFLEISVLTKTMNMINIYYQYIIALHYIHIVYKFSSSIVCYIIKEKSKYLYIN